MYADRHARSSALDPRSLGIAVAVNAVAVAALLLAQPVFTVIKHDKPLETYRVPIDPVPDEVPPETKPHPAQRQTIVTPRRVIERQSDLTQPVDRIDLPPLPPLPPTGDIGPGTGPATTPTQPVTIGAEVDLAHRGDLQPTYPASELRAEHEGSVVVRVLIGIDGRVHQVEQVSATSDAFFRATQERALAKWRFRPATRGGVAVEAWRMMTIRFVIPR